MCLVHVSYKASVSQTRQEDIAVFPLQNTSIFRAPYNISAHKGDYLLIVRHL